MVQVPGQAISTWPCTSAFTTCRSGNNEPLSNSLVVIWPSDAASSLPRKSRNATLRGCDGAVSSEHRNSIGAAASARRMKGVARATAAEAPKARRVMVFGIGAPRTFQLSPKVTALRGSAPSRRHCRHGTPCHGLPSGQAPEGRLRPGHPRLADLVTGRPGVTGPSQVTTQRDARWPDFAARSHLTLARQTPTSAITSFTRSGVICASCTALSCTLTIFDVHRVEVGLRHVDECDAMLGQFLPSVRLRRRGVAALPRQVVRPKLPHRLLQLRDRAFPRTPG